MLRLAVAVRNRVKAEGTGNWDIWAVQIDQVRPSWPEPTKCPGRQGSSTRESRRGAGARGLTPVAPPGGRRNGDFARIGRNPPSNRRLLCVYRSGRAGDMMALRQRVCFAPFL